MLEKIYVYCMCIKLHNRRTFTVAFYMAKPFANTKLFLDAFVYFLSQTWHIFKSELLKSVDELWISGSVILDTDSTVLAFGGNLALTSDSV